LAELSVTVGDFDLDELVAVASQHASEVHVRAAGRELEQAGGGLAG
jgi:hypothetical protein